MTPSHAFAPIAATKTLAITGTSAAIATTGNNLSGQYRIANVGTQTVFIVVGAAGTTPTATVAAGIPLLANTVEVFTFPPTVVVAGIAAAAGSTLYITPGQGV